MIKIFPEIIPFLLSGYFRFLFISNNLKYVDGFL